MEIRVCLVEDDTATREGLVQLLGLAPEIRCLGAFSTVKAAVQSLKTLTPDIFLVDINLPDQSGIECVSQLKALRPELELVMLTTFDDTENIFASLRAGASGYLLKRNAPNDLIPAIKSVFCGGSPMSMKIARIVVSHFQQIPQPAANAAQSLTKREQEIMHFLSKGLPYKQIADSLGITSGTVHCHLHTIYKKLHVQSRTEAVVKFLKP